MTKKVKEKEQRSCMECDWASITTAPQCNRHVLDPDGINYECFEPKKEQPTSMSEVYREMHVNPTVAQEHKESLAACVNYISPISCGLHPEKVPERDGRCKDYEPKNQQPDNDAQAPNEAL